MCKMLAGRCKVAVLHASVGVPTDKRREVGAHLGRMPIIVKGRFIN